MGKEKKTLEEGMDDVFANWAVGPEARKNLELYQPNEEKDTNTPASSTEQEQGASKAKDQKPSANNRSSKSSPQKRTFQNRPGDLSDTAFTPIDDIPEQHFLSYFNALYDMVLPQLSPMSALILCMLFKKSHGLNRNWCQMSLPEFTQIIQASRNTIRVGLKSLIEDGWVCIITDGYNEATTYGLCIPVEIDEE